MKKQVHTDTPAYMPPHDPELEKIVLGTVISNRHGYDEVRDILHEDCFYDDFHRRVFRIFREIEAKGAEPDIAGIASLYKAGTGEIKLVELAGMGELTEVTQVYSHTLRLSDLDTRRKLVQLADRVRLEAYTDSTDIADITAYCGQVLKNLYSMPQNPVTTIQDAIKGVYSIIEANKTNKCLSGSPTGFRELDSRTGGLQKSDLVIIAGETSQGKTSFAMSVLNNTVKYGSRVAVYSLEMKKEQLTARLMAMESGIPAAKLLYAPLEDHRFGQLDKSISPLYHSGIYFDDRSTSNIDNILSSIRMMKARYDIDGAVVDYLQILTVNMKGAGKEQQMADAARRLKNIARELDIWVIALSQLSRDASNPEPNINRLRDSGQIGEAADNIYFVYRPELYRRDFPEPFKAYDTQAKALIIGGKGRNTGLVSFLVSFNSETTQFTDIESPVLKNEGKRPF
ncbi:replicative DNA helicase [Dysgonomonas termitidis]